MGQKEAGEKNIMDHAPRHPKKKMLNRNFILHFFYIGAVIALVTLMSYLWDLNRLHITLNESTINNPNYIQACTLAFMILVVTELAHALNARSSQTSIFKMNPLSNTRLLYAIGISLAMAILLIEVPFLQQYFHTTALDSTEWLIVFSSTIIVIAAEEIRKFINNHSHPKNKKCSHD